MIESLFLLFGFLMFGELVSFVFSLPIPGSVIGMVVLTLSFRLGIIKTDVVKPGSDVLLKNMSFLFVPPGVGLILYLELIWNELIPICISYFLSTCIVLWSSAFIVERLERK